MEHQECIPAILMQEDSNKTRDESRFDKIVFKNVDYK